MAAVLIRRGTGLCCVHRVFWRSQTALFSSKPSDRKQPRRTHIKKAKPQPAVDVAKLLEQLFSQRRPSTTPAAGKARPAKASSVSTKPPATSSVNVSSSNVPPLSKTDAAMSVFPAAPSLDVRSLSNVTSDSSSTSTTPASSSDAAAVEHQTSTETIETKVETASEINTGMSSSPADSGELTVEPSVVHILPCVDTQEVTSAVKDPVEVPTKDTDWVGLSHKEPLIETEIESVEVSYSTLQTSETRGPVEPAIEAIVAQKETKNMDSGVVDISHGAAVEPLIELTIEPPVEHILPPIGIQEEVTSAVVDPVEGPTRDTDPGMVEGPLIESPGEVSYSPVETPENRGAIVGGPVKPTIEDIVSQKVGTRNTDSGVVDISHSATVGALIEDSSVPLETLDSRCVADGSAQAAQTSCTDSGVVNISHSARQEPLIETTSISPVSDGTGEQAVTLEPLTLAKVKLEAGRCETEGTRNGVEKDADVSANEKTVDPTTKDVAVFDDTTEAEILTRQSVSESSDAINAATTVMLEAMSGCKQGTGQLLVDEKLGEQDKATGQDAEKESVEQQESRVEAMTLESVTLAEVQASLGTLESESLTEAACYLEKEAGIAAGEKRTEVDDTVASEDTLSLPEAAALSEDLQIDVLMEELLFTIPGHVAGGQTGQEIVKAADADTASAVTDDIPLKDVLQEVEEQGAHAEALEIEDGEGTHKDLDPVQRLFLEKIKEYNTQRLDRGLLEAEPEYKKYLSEEMAKLQRLHGGGDMSSFPQFTFTEPQMDQDSK